MKILNRTLCLLSSALLLASCGGNNCNDQRGNYKDSLIYSQIITLGNTDMNAALAKTDSAVTAKALDPTIGNLARGVVYMNHTRSRLANYYTSKAYGDSTLRNYKGQYLQALSVMAETERFNGRYDHGLEYAQHGLDYAREMKDTAYIGQFLYNIGQNLLSGVSDKEKAYDYFYKSIKVLGDMQQNGTWARADKKVYVLMNTMISMKLFGDVKQAVGLIPKLDNAMKYLAVAKDANPVFLDMRQANRHYVVSSLYLAIGEKYRADQEFEKFLKTNYGKSDIGAGFHGEYLKDSKNYVNALKMYDIYETRFKAVHDTITQEFVDDIIVPKFELYHLLGQDDKAVLQTIRGKDILDSCKQRSMKADVEDLNIAYETSQKEDKLQNQRFQIMVMRYVIVAGLLVVLILLVLGYRIFHYNRIITHKNRIAVQNIQQLLSYKEQLEAYEGQSIASSECHKSIDEIEKIEKPSDEDSDKELFKRVSFLINSQKLYLQPKLSREDVIKMSKCPRNKFAQLFTQYAGMTFNKYINDLRLEYAAKLLRDKPEYTIEAIAEECGLPIAQTFYRNFSDKFGVTPNDFRLSLS